MVNETDNQELLNQKDETINKLIQENERLRNRELNDNERRVITCFRDEIPKSDLSTRLRVAREMLTYLKSNDLSIEANPNLSTQGISLPERLVANLEQIVWICEFYLQMEERLNKEIKDLEDRIQELEAKDDNNYEKMEELGNILSFGQGYTLIKELKRLKTQDLTIQIPLKKQELEVLTNNLKEKLTRAERYPLEKLLKKHSKTLQTNNNSNSTKINELKEILSEKLTKEGIQTLLNKQKEVFNLEKHLESLQTEQTAQIVHNPPRNNN